MYYTGIDPFSKKAVPIARNLRDRKMQRALTQFFKPENDFTVWEALIKAGRTDLIGGYEGLIPVQHPIEAIEARRRKANHAVNGREDNDSYHTVITLLWAKCQGSVSNTLVVSGIGAILGWVRIKPMFDGSSQLNDSMHLAPTQQVITPATVDPMPDTAREEQPAFPKLKADEKGR